MGLELLAHYNVRTPRLQETRDFYVDVLGLTEGARPEFPFPGYWLYCGDRDVLHLVGITEDQSGVQGYLGDRVGSGIGGGAIDHVAFTATGVAEIVRRLEHHGITARHRRVPNLDLYQIFVDDPNGITIEINFPGSEAPPEQEARVAANAPV